MARIFTSILSHKQEHMGKTREKTLSCGVIWHIINCDTVIKINSSIFSSGWLILIRICKASPTEITKQLTSNNKMVSRQYNKQK